MDLNYANPVFLPKVSQVAFVPYNICYVNLLKTIT